MTRESLITWAKSHGFTVDRYGHLVKADIRIKLSSVSARWEVRRPICGRNEWIRVRSGYYSKLSVTAEGKLTGMMP